MTPPPPTPRRSPRPTLVVLLLLAVPLTACSSDDDSSPTTTPKSEEAQVEAAYGDYWEMADRLAEAPDPDNPELSQLASGDALEQLKSGLAELQEQRRIVEVGPRTSHEVSDVTIVEPGSARLDDCDVDDSRLLSADGEVLDEGITTTHWSVTLSKSDGEWRVDRFERLGAWEGEVACR